MNHGSDKREFRVAGVAGCDSCGSLSTRYTLRSTHLPDCELRVRSLNVQWTPDHSSFLSPHYYQQASRGGARFAHRMSTGHQINPHSSALIPINRPRAGALGSLTKCRIVVDVLLGISEACAGALGSLTECRIVVDVLLGISEASRGGARFAHRMSDCC